MKTRCPACGATNSLDSLIAHLDAKKSIATAMGLSGELGSALIQYLSLFRPKKSELSFTQVAKRLSELLPYITTEQVVIEGETHQAPKEAWIWAINEMLQNETVNRPIKSHVYLYKVVSSYVFVEPNASTPSLNKAKKIPQALTSATGQGVADLQGLKDD